MPVHEPISRTEVRFAVLVLKPEIVVREWEEMPRWIPGRHPRLCARAVSSSSSSLTLISFFHSLCVIMIYRLEWTWPQ